MSVRSETPHPAPPVNPQSTPAVKGSAGRVLLLDDRDDFRDVIQDHLIFRGYNVVSVPTGVEGLREIMNAHFRFDLIICDVMMPKLGGEMFYWAVSRARPGVVRRFIFFTGHQNDPAINFFFERVNATVLRKPFRMQELDSVMSEVLRKLR
jgi:DNA-binding response OmpR family regulator